MSTNKKNWTDGEALTTVEMQRVATIAAGMDDRAWEGLFTPGSVQKKVIPLSEETASVIPSLLMIPGLAGAVRLTPAILIAGGSGLPNHINMSAKLEAFLDSAALASNVGSTRYDLIYATISYTTSVTGSRKVKDVNTGTVSTQSLNLEKAMQVVLTVLPNVSNATPTATMPADPVDGSSYNIALCYVTVLNGYTSGTVLLQSAITPLWARGAVSQQRVRGARPASITYGGAAEKPSSFLNAGTQGAERWSAGALPFFAHFKILPSTSVSMVDIRATGVLIDNTIDWRNRIVYGFYAMIGSGAQAPIEAAGVPLAMLTVQTKTGTNPQGVYNYGVIPPLWTGPGINNASLINLPYADGIPNTYNQLLGVDTNGVLRAMKQSTPQDNTNGDLFVVILFASEKMVALG